MSKWDSYLSKPVKFTIQSSTVCGWHRNNSDVYDYPLSPTDANLKSLCVFACKRSLYLGLLTLDFPHRRRAKCDSVDPPWPSSHLPTDFIQLYPNCMWPQCLGEGVSVYRLGKVRGRGLYAAKGKPPSMRGKDFYSTVALGVPHATVSSPTHMLCKWVQKTHWVPSGNFDRIELRFVIGILQRYDWVFPQPLPGRKFSQQCSNDRSSCHLECLSLLTVHT